MWSGTRRKPKNRGIRATPTVRRRLESGNRTTPGPGEVRRPGERLGPWDFRRGGGVSRRFEQYAKLLDWTERLGADLLGRFVRAVAEEVGAMARPANVIFVDDVPRTPSGKITSRLLENTSNDDEFGDTTTLRDPFVPEDVRRQVQGD